MRPAWSTTWPSWSPLPHRLHRGRHAPRTTSTGWKLLTEQAGRQAAAGRRRSLRHQRRRGWPMGIEKGIANSILIKVNQIGTLIGDAGRGRAGPPRRLHRGDVATAPARPRTRPSPTSRSPPTAARSRPARSPAPTAWRSTTSCCASRRSWATRPSTPGADCAEAASVGRPCLTPCVKHACTSFSTLRAPQMRRVLSTLTTYVPTAILAALIFYFGFNGPDRRPRPALTARASATPRWPRTRSGAGRLDAERQDLEREARLLRDDSLSRRPSRGKGATFAPRLRRPEGLCDPHARAAADDAGRTFAERSAASPGRAMARSAPGRRAADSRQGEADAGSRPPTRRRCSASTARCC